MTLRDTTGVLDSMRTGEPVLLPPPANSNARTLSYRTDESVADLLASLRFRRPRGGPTEQRFINQFLDAEIDDLKQDESGNIFKIVGQAEPTIVWSCHTDSVHRMEGEQAVTVDGDWIRLPKNSKSNCLGADDMAGVWVMRKMIAAGVPGLYIFHYGEESGGIGSGFIADKHPEYVKGIKSAVAFDRRNFGDIITHQAGGRCCSDDYALSLSALLPSGYKKSSGGIFTDTANYTQLIPECTNLSVGYFDEHTTSEKLNIPHILSLRDSLVKITQADIDALVIQRDPAAVDNYEWDDYSGYGSMGGGGFYGWRGSSHGAKSGIYTSRYGNKYKSVGAGTAAAGAGLLDDGAMYDEQETQDLLQDSYLGDSASFAPQNMEELIRQYPNSMAKLLEGYGFSFEDMWEEVNQILYSRKG